MLKLTDEQTEPDLKTFCQIALQLAQNNVFHTEMLTDTNLRVAVDITVLGVEKDAK